MTKSNQSRMFHAWVLALVAFSLSLAWSMGAYAQEEGPGTVCILQVEATGEIFTTIVDDTLDIDLAVLVPRDNVSNIPVRCQEIAQERMGAAVANQEPFDISVLVRGFNNQGELQCTRGPYTLAVNGGRGFAFKGCL
jgi:hypothetical protein